MTQAKSMTSEKTASLVLGLRSDATWLDGTAERLAAHPDRVPFRPTALRQVAAAIRRAAIEIERLSAADNTESPAS